MSSTGEDRSLASGIPIPQWMRNKTETHGFDPSALSPPQHEGDFFYIKLPKPQFSEASNVKTLSTVVEGKEQTFIRRTESSPQFMSNIQDTMQFQKPKIIKPIKINDQLNEEEASSGSSVVEVAHQMLGNKSFKPLLRGETEGSLAPPPSYLRKRRDSKSLPASPLGSPQSSPRTVRKSYSRLFGGTLFSTENLNASEEDVDKKSGSSWILATLFAAKESEKESVGEKGSFVKYDPDSKKAVAYKKDSSDDFKEPVNVAMAVESVSPEPASTSKASFLKSKPHLRDLNFLTPSSM